MIKDHEKFEIFMKSIDEEFLTEAMQTASKEPGFEKSKTKSNRSLRRWALRGSIALICLCLFGVGINQVLPKEDVAQAATLEEIEAQGYDMSLPEEAESVSYYWYQTEDDKEDIAQAVFVLDGTEYTYRILLNTESTQLFSAEQGSGETLEWSGPGYQITAEDNADQIVICWYSPESQTQWSLLSDDTKSDAVTAAYSILINLGFDVGTAPEGAENVVYNIIEIKPTQAAQNPEAVEGITAAQLEFDLNGVHYTYRAALPKGVPDEVPDISEDNTEYTNSLSDFKIGWCKAEAYYNEAGMGKILWFDIAPGVTYSLTMSSNAGEETLIEMASRLYRPLQDDM